MMGGSSWWRQPLMVLLILCVLLLPVSRGCFPEERAALMEIHTSLVRAMNSTYSAVRLPMPPNPLPWGEAGNDDCCSWERVRCSNATRRVSHLHLSGLYWCRFSDSRIWSLHTTDFAAFPELQYLDLSYNRPTLIRFDGFKNLGNLRELHLSSNNISGNLQSFLFSLPHIEVLDVSGNMVEGQIAISSSSSNTSNLLSFDGLKNLSNLRELDMSDNNISGNLPSFLFSLPHIEVLNLSRNMIEGPIPISSSSNLALSFRSLRLSGNNLSGRLSFFWLKDLVNLVEIDLSGNANLGVTVNIPGWVPLFQLNHLYLSGCDLDKDIIAKPNFLRTQHHLEDLDLSSNNLSGGMPNWLLTKGSTLVYLYLSNNNFTGSLGPIWYPQRSLIYIDISMNQIVGLLPANLSSIFPNLFYIDFSSNNFSGEIPISLCDVNNISTLYLSNNMFSGEMPACMFTDLPVLFIFRASNNYLGGTIFGGRSKMTLRLEELALDGNKFEGALPRNLSGEIVILDLHDNNLTGELDASSWSLSQLELLDVSGNYMTGEIQPQICALPSIRYLDLSNNQFTGPIRNCNSASLGSLNVSMNLLSGDVSWENFNTSNLLNLNVGHNMLTGNLSWVHPFHKMSVLTLRQNEFHGQIPPSLCNMRSLRMIDLSYNKLSGSVPRCIGAISFQDTSLLSQDLMYHFINDWYAAGRYSFDTKGMKLTYGTNVALMSGINLSNNSLSGEIPRELGDLSHVKSLNLSCNALVGRIPPSLANMSEVESLDLSHNKLTGAIPMELTRLWSLEVFSVAYNRLSGCVPSSGQFGTFNATSYEGNSQLLMKCSSSSAGLEPRDEMVVDDAGPYAIAAASFVLTFWTTVAFSFCHSTGRRMVLRLAHHCSYVLLSMYLACHTLFNFVRSFVVPLVYSST